VEFPEFHRRMIDAVLTVADQYGLLLCGGYAVRAHGLVERPSKDVDFATCEPIPLDEVAKGLVVAFGRCGLDAVVLRGNPRSVRLAVTDPVSGVTGETDLLKEALQGSPVTISEMRVVGLEDLIAMKTRALGGRGMPRDLIDVASAADLYSFAELERMALKRDDEFSRDDLAIRLDGYHGYDDKDFTDYGLDDDGVRRVRGFAFRWSVDLAERRYEEGAFLDVD
jgi:Nucleotidyl transferase AbiEii toxin, Type IV TA system